MMALKETAMNVMVTQGAEGLPRRAFTVEDAFRMLETGILQDDERVELIEGEFVPMNAKNRIHQRVQDDLVMALARLLPVGFRVGTEPTLQLSETTFLSPDLVIYRDFSGERLTPRDVPGRFRLALFAAGGPTCALSYSPSCSPPYQRLGHPGRRSTTRAVPLATAAVLQRRHA